jgi:hypothetical protein
MEMWPGMRGQRAGRRLFHRRDAEQATAAARLVSGHMPQLPFEADVLRMLPLTVFEQARLLFAAT